MEFSILIYSFQLLEFEPARVVRCDEDGAVMIGYNSDLFLGSHGRDGDQTLNDSGICDDGQMSRESSLIRISSRQKSDLATPPTEETSADLSSVNEETGMAAGSKLATLRSQLLLSGSGKQPSFTQITRKSEAPFPNKAGSNIQKPEKRSFMETNFLQTPETSNITLILPETGPGGSSASTPGPESGGKSSASGSPVLTQVILSNKLEEKITNIQLQQEITNKKDDMEDVQMEDNKPKPVKRRKTGGVKNKRRKHEEDHIDHNYVIRSR